MKHGKTHRIIPELNALAAILSQLKQEADGIDMLNYGGRKAVISDLVHSAISEVDRLILLDIYEVNNERTQNH